jgi:hypothetical protein
MGGAYGIEIYFILSTRDSRTAAHFLLFVVLELKPSSKPEHISPLHLI